MRIRTLLAVASLTAVAGTAVAQPKLVITAIADDLSANGNSVVGWVYDSSINHYAPFKYTRGVGYQRIAGTAPGGGGPISCSADASVLAAPMDNAANWEGLNCFAGYDADGSPKVVQNPCSTPPPAIAHRYTAANGWVNTGSLPRYPDPVTGRMIGGTRCDYTINTPYNISANGRYIVGGAYSALAFNGAGNPSFGFCGDYFAFRYDSQTGVFEKLPTSSHTTLANFVSGDGSVVTGYDLNVNTRQQAAWYNGVETILDPYAFRGAPINGSGTAIAMGASPSLAITQLGVSGNPLVKWNRTGSSWTPQVLGVPADYFGFPCNLMVPRGISDDGNTIVGDAYYGAEPGQLDGEKRFFIWRPSINGGVPMDLDSYLVTIDPTGEATAGTRMSNLMGLSADGNTLLINGDDTRVVCEVGQTLNTFFAGMLSLNGAAVGNEPPSIAMQPADMGTRCEWPGWGEPMNVTAGGSWPLNYQWQREDPSNPGSWINLTNACSGAPEETFPHDSSWEFEGVTGSQLRINVVNQGGGHDGRYRVIVSNAYGSVTSQPATFSFLPALNVLNPVDAVACPGSPAIFTVGPVTGLGECRWEVCTSPENDTWVILSDGDNLLPFGSVHAEGSRTPTASITPLTLPAGGQFLFRCHIADSCNLLDTNPATLTVGSPCGPADLGTQGGLPVTCGDGHLDNNDFIVFITYFFAGNPLADQGIQGGLPGHDGQFDNNDFISFINNFFVGCNN